MSYVIAAPEYVAAAATDLANIGSAISDANTAAVIPTTGAFLPAGTDAVSTELAALFGAHAEAFQALSAQAAAFHDQFVQLMNLGSQSYAVTEAANVSNVQTGVVSVPQQTLGPGSISEGSHAAPAAAAMAAQTMALGAAAAGPAGSAIAPATAPVGPVGSAIAAGAVRPVGSVTRQPVSAPPASSAEPAEIEETAAVSALPAPLAARAVPAAAIAGAPTARIQAAGEATPAAS